MNRRVAAIAWLAGTGVVLNVVVAWACSLASSFRPGSALELYAPVGEAHHWTVYRWNRPGATRIISQSWHGEAGGPYTRGAPEMLLASWGRIEPPTPETSGTVIQLDEGGGFPLRAMACGFDHRTTPDGTRVEERRHLLRLAAADEPGGRPRYLPLRPLWVGFTANSVLYALATLVVWALARDLVRWIRHRQAPS